MAAGSGQGEGRIRSGRCKEAAVLMRRKCAQGQVRQLNNLDECFREMEKATGEPIDKGGWCYRQSYDWVSGGGGSNVRGQRGLLKAG